MALVPHRPAVASIVGLSLFLSAAVFLPVSLSAQTLTLERVMADPDWIGRAPQNAFWDDLGGSVYYRQKRPGEEILDFIQVDLEGTVIRLVGEDELSSVPVAGGDLDPENRRRVFVHLGDVYVRDVESGQLRQLTRTASDEQKPIFLTDGASVAWVRDGSYFVRNLETGLESQPFDVLLQDDPADEDTPDYLESQQTRLFDFVRESQENRQNDLTRARRRRLADARRADPAWYLGKDRAIAARALSPTGHWLALVTTKADHEAGRQDTLPRFVTEEGFVENEDVRVKVGNRPAPQSLVLLHAPSRTRWDPDTAGLPAIDVDPLADLKAQKAARAAEENNGEEEDGAKSRPVRYGELLWSPDGSRLAVQIFSLDNKDRWIATVDLETGELQPVDHLHDEAWINWSFNTVGWLPDNESLYFLSEESGFSHLYVDNVKGGARKSLTSGSFVVCPRGSNPEPYLSRDGTHLYFPANRSHSGRIEIYRVDVATAKLEQLTELGGVTRFVVSPDERSLLLTHSTATRPPELFVQETKTGARPRRLTETVSDEFSGIPWTAPHFVEIPSSNVERPIHSRLYLPAADTERSGAAVIFIHGAGYLQNAHHGWSGYFREFMFHSLLTQRGIVVLDMDYRGSAGYGRDWRTAIYRQMGTPEVEDLGDGARWLTENHGVDAHRIGAYGGSYGGFLTLMGLFREPDLFAAGAALRPVTDWAHYNHGYTSNILNTPDLDPEAYERSSPIEFADGLTKPLLLCHGVLDNNVLFQDTARLVQRLIELEKTDWEVAMFPVERHGFRQPSSWLDEYRRILALFDRTLN